MVVWTLVRPPAKTQKVLDRAQPSSTLTTTSTLVLAKNQKYPVSAVSATAWPPPAWPAGVSQVATAWKRLLPRQSEASPSTQVPIGVAGRISGGPGGWVQAESAARSPGGGELSRTVGRGSGRAPGARS